jgi:thiamine-phosphate diphosphorylase/hydroxyethylthiazole kinase
MATNPADVADLSPAIGSLLINVGTINDKEGMLVAGRHANINRKPLVFDPVAVGATSFRRDTTERECDTDVFVLSPTFHADITPELLNHWQPTVIKGNAAEIGALARSSEVAARGVDSVGKGFRDPGAVVRALARERNAVVVLTGETDYLSDGNVVLRTSNGHELVCTLLVDIMLTPSSVSSLALGA